MKRLFIIQTMMLIALMANAQSCPDDNHPHTIDLGLPSGTEWACCNVGASFPEGNGGYYAWGETKEKERYDWSTYFHCDDSKETCHDIGSDIAGTEYDVAHVQWGGSWVMPSKDQFLELVTQCSYTKATKKGVEGGLFTGPSGGTIFLPAADIRWDGFRECIVLGGFYWSSTSESYSDGAYRLSFDLSWGGGSGIEERAHALTVRPVISKDPNGNSVSATSKVFLSSDQNASSCLYDLQGRRLLQQPARGVYIENGRKKLGR